jgi:hypothetical protein
MWFTPKQCCQCSHRNLDSNPKTEQQRTLKRRVGLKFDPATPSFFQFTTLKKLYMFWLGCPVRKDLQTAYLELCSEETFHILVCEETVSLPVGANRDSGSSQLVAFSRVNEDVLGAHNGKDEFQSSVVSGGDALGDDVNDALGLLFER